MKEDIINQINSLLELEVFKNTYQDLVPENLLSKKMILSSKIYVLIFHNI